MKRPKPIVRRSRSIPSNPDRSGATSDEELIRLWLSGRAERTRKAYTEDVAWWRAHGVPGPGGLRGLRFAAIERAFEELEGAEATKARRVAALRSLLAWGHRLGYLEINLGAVLRLRPVPNKLAERILERDQVLELLSAAGKSPRHGARNHLLVRVAYVSGARVAELVGLDWIHVHPSAKGGATLTFTVKGGKTRHVWVTAGTAAELEAFRGEATAGPIFRSRFGTRLGVRDAERMIEAAAKRAKLGKVSPHWLRHAHGTHALELGAPIHEVQDGLGHASVATTSRYLHARPGPGSARFLGL